MSLMVVQDPQLVDALLARAHELISACRFQEGMNELTAGLLARRLKMSDAEWGECIRTCLGHRLRDLVHQDPFTYRSFSKPRGYAGDAVLLDYIYSVEQPELEPADMTPTGRGVFDYMVRMAAAVGVRYRRRFLAQRIDRLAAERPRPDVLSLAAGHCREAEYSTAIRERRLGRMVALDSDAESLQELTRCYGDTGIEPLHASVRQLITGRLDPGKFDLVYATGLLDYLTDNAALRLISTMFALLRPGGQLVVANFLPGISARGYMESYMDWRLIYRTRKEMIELAADVPQAAIGEIRLWAEDRQNIIFLEISRR